MSRTHRPRKPRRVIVHDLRLLKTRLINMISRWDVPGTVYVGAPDRQPGENLYLRERQPDEYPENQAEAWRRLIDELDHQAEICRAVRAYAQRQLHELAGTTAEESKP